uniref:AT-rich interactive domain-containing protein 3 n=1 Tax=Accipiter nisus TaxID=211598 RepID=A0A8B9MA65_9AVES
MCRAVGRGVGSRQKLPQQKRVLEAQPCQKPCPGLPAPAQKDTSRLRSAVWRGGVHPAGFAPAAVPWAAWKPWGRRCSRRIGGQPHGHCPMGTKPHWCSPRSVPASPGRGEQALPGGMAASGMPQLGGCPATGYRSGRQGMALPSWGSCQGAGAGQPQADPMALCRDPPEAFGILQAERLRPAGSGPRDAVSGGLGLSGWQGAWLGVFSERLSSLVAQLYELDGDPRRKEFLDDLFSFMQKRGTPVNRIPIMAKQVLDLYMLYTLVTEKGGLVEVINKKLWREITKGLNLPTSITSAAFTLRTQYMKYLYPYECEKRGLSNPNELQAAIDSNRREGRRQGFGSSLFTYSPGGTHGLLSSPKLPVPALGLASATNGGSIAPVQKIKKEEDSPIPISMPSRLPVSLAGHPVVAAQAAAVQVAAAAQAAALEQLREKLESGEPPEKKMALVTDEQQRLMQRALQQNLLAMTAQLPMSIRINSQENRQDSTAGLSSNGTNSISMSVEINGIVYTGEGLCPPLASAPSPGNPSGAPGPWRFVWGQGSHPGRAVPAAGRAGSPRHGQLACTPQPPVSPVSVQGLGVFAHLWGCWGRGARCQSRCLSCCPFCLAGTSLGTRCFQAVALFSQQRKLS